MVEQFQKNNEMFKLFLKKLKIIMYFSKEHLFYASSTFLLEKVTVNNRFETFNNFSTCELIFLGKMKNPVWKKNTRKFVLKKWNQNTHTWIRRKTFITHYTHGFSQLPIKKDMPKLGIDIVNFRIVMVYASLSARYCSTEISRKM